jgi:phospholipid/cholesterol/gamma-HCH transport system permease protein
MKVLDEVGQGTTDVFAYAGGVAELGADAARFIVRLQIRVRETFDQAYFLGVGSWSIVVLTSLFTGLVISLESAQQAVQYGVGSFVGGAVTYVAARELGPLLTAIVVGSGIAAELGSMVVTEQIEALQALGLSPTRMLVVPRLVALLVMLPLLTIIADVVAIGAGAWMANVYAHISFQTFLESARSTVPFLDFLKGMGKAAVFAIIIALIGSYQGLSTRGGAAGVGRSTTSAVVTAIILIFVFNFALSYVLFGGGR